MVNPRLAYPPPYLCANYYDATYSNLALNFGPDELSILNEMPLDEHYFGFGEKAGRFDKRGAHLVMRNRDPYIFMEVYPGNGEFLWYEDDGESLEGDFALRRITAGIRENELEIEIKEVDGKGWAIRC